MTKNEKAETAYMMPSFLWSTVKTQARHPVVATGRRKTPMLAEGVTPPARASSRGAEGCSMIAMFRGLRQLSVLR